MRIMRVCCVVLVATVLLGMASYAALVDKDMMGGIGSFDFCPVTYWWASYAGADYDYESESEWVSPADVNGSREGYDKPQLGDQVAAGWFRYTGDTTNPGSNIIYDIVSDETGFSSNCQYFALKDIHSGTAWARLMSSPVYVNDTKSWWLHTGDTLTWRIDDYKMSGHESLPSGTTVAYKAFVYFAGPNSAEEELIPVQTQTGTPFTFDPVVVPQGTEAVYLEIQIMVTGDLGSSRPGLHLDNVHLYVDRGGNRLQEELPLASNRSIKTGYAYFTFGLQDPYEIAANYDYVMTSEGRGDTAELLRAKYYNPNLKTYMYKIPAIHDGREKDTSYTSYGEDRWYSSAPVRFKYTLDNYREWLYGKPCLLDEVNPPSCDPDPQQYLCCPYDLNDPPYYGSGTFPLEFYAHLDNPVYQSLWALNAAELAKRFRFNGVFIDGPSVILKDPQDEDSPERRAWEGQSFLHTIVPELTKAGLDVIENHCTGLVSNEYPTRIWFDPTWSANQTYTTCDGYSNNNPTTTADGLWNEWCFTKINPTVPCTVYNKVYWKSCLDDIATVSGWNASLGANEKKYRHCQTEGVDAPEDPAYGPYGWIQFGLCSYLLAANEYTTFWTGQYIHVDNIGAKSRFVDVDYEITRHFTDPVGPYVEIGSDDYFCTRGYYSTDAGANGGSVVVNGDDSASRNYVATADYVDETGRFFPKGTTVVMPASTGKIFMRLDNYKYSAVISSPSEGAVLTNSSCTISGSVVSNRLGLPKPSYVQVKIDDGSWVNCSVNALWMWSYNWSGYTEGRHTIKARVYIDAGDCEPEKYGRTVTYDPSGDYVAYTTIGEVLLEPDDTKVKLTGKRVISAKEVASGTIWIQDTDPADGMIHGIRVQMAAGQPVKVAEGELVDVTGTTDGGSSGIGRLITDAVVSLSGNQSSLGDPYVFAMTTRAVGGDAIGSYTFTSSPHKGMYNQENLVRIAGEVSSVYTDYFIVDDIRVYCPDLNIPVLGSQVVVTGISTSWDITYGYVAEVRPRSQADIRVIAASELVTHQAVLTSNCTNYVGIVGVPVTSVASDVFKDSVGNPIAIDGNLQRVDHCQQTWATYSAQDPSAFGPVSWADGFGLSIGPNAVTWQYESIPTSMLHKIESPENYDCAWLNLSGAVCDGQDAGGYHLFSIPTDCSVDVSDVWVARGIEVKSYADAVTAGWIDDTWVFDGGIVTEDSSSTTDLLFSGYAYQILTYVDNVALLFGFKH